MKLISGDKFILLGRQYTPVMVKDHDVKKSTSGIGEMHRRDVMQMFGAGTGINIGLLDVLSNKKNLGYNTSPIERHWNTLTVKEIEAHENVQNEHFKTLDINNISDNKLFWLEEALNDGPVQLTGEDTWTFDFSERYVKIDDSTHYELNLVHHDIWAPSSDSTGGIE